jgi:hypothetical protein
MTMADVFAIVFILAGLFIALPCLWLFYAALWPNAVGRAQERVQQMPVRTFFLGAFVSLVLWGLVALLGRANLPVPAMLLAGFTVGFSLFGVAGFTRLIGSKMPSTIDIPWRAHLRGSIVVELSFLVPVVGWLLIFPIALTLGTGAATLAALSRTPARVPRREEIEVMA